MTVQSKKREKVGWSQPETWYKNPLISYRTAETTFELMESEMENKVCKLLNDLCIRKMELQTLRSEMHFSPESDRISSAMELRCLAGQSTNVQTAQTTRRGPSGNKEGSFGRDRIYDSSDGGVNDEVWKHLRMSCGIPALPESPELGSTSDTWSNSVERVGLRPNCNNENINRGLMELCNLSDTGPSGEVQSASSPRGMILTRGNKINAHVSSSKYENTLQDKKFNVDLFKTEICRCWRKFGTCIHGKFCHFAHGIEELRVRPKPHRNYKTQMCKKFLAGFCPYGSRCCFVHSSNEQYLAITNEHIVANGRLGVMAHCKENRDMIRRWHR